MRRKTIRRRVMRSGLLLSNIFVLLIVIFFVLQSNKPQVKTTSSILNNTAATADLNPVDQLSSANIAYKIMKELNDIESVGPILMGMDRAVHIVQLGARVDEMVNMTTIAVVDAQEREKKNKR